ncbi:MAG: stage II sporulation protein P, partial [Oscillospiraceae bacterium]|nr:stage II sporulation protein P [Candidatus Equicaccousia limihippi]
IKDSMFFMRFMMLKRFSFSFMVLVLAVAAAYTVFSVMPFPICATAVNSKANFTADMLPQEIGQSGENVESKPQTADVSSAVEAVSKGTVKGKISEEVLSPYKANLSYGKIFLKNSTGVAVNLKNELAAGVKFKIEQNGKPQVLIVSTHTSECYMEQDRNYYTDQDKTGTYDQTKNVLCIGKIIKENLCAAGICALQSEAVHDKKFSGSYSASAATVKEYLKKYPSIKVVIDVHRDSVNYDNGTKIKPTVKIDGKKAAQVMLVIGCEAGQVEGFPKWRENFRLAIRLQQQLENDYPSLARSGTFTPRKYNQHLTTGSLLIEMGTEANTLDEAKYSAQLLSNSLIKTLKNL